MTHYIVKDGAFSNIYAGKGFKIDWQSPIPPKNAKAKADSKTKFSCPECEANAWAKSDMRLICGLCYEDDGSINGMIAEVK
jgi:hypothetical protein